MNNVQFFIQQESRRYEQLCESALRQVRQALSMLEVKRAMHVPKPSVLRGIHLPKVGIVRELELAAERRMTALLDEQLKHAAGIADLDARKTYLGQLQSHDWIALQGDFPALCRKADIEGQRLLAEA
ncbi:TPA: hypothetical protein QDB04_000198 [Burkholderia vietnamiensis]|nr:hypothetical protein [Burkholderia vietnamiensis]